MAFFDSPASSNAYALRTIMLGSQLAILSALPKQYAAWLYILLSNESSPTFSHFYRLGGERYVLINKYSAALSNYPKSLLKYLVPHASCQADDRAQECLGTELS